MKEKIKERFIRYAKIDTRSDENSKTTPSTKSQADFIEMLSEELIQLGLSEVKIDKNSYYLTAKLPSNSSRALPSIGFIAHVDTADFESRNIQPQVHENYDGSEICLNEDENIILSPADFPNLKNYIGHTLITTNGLTLLGADDKAGIAEIISAFEYILAHPEIEHGDIKLGFGPDEEIGIGADKFDAEDFATDFAYTLDGSVLGELQYESFNAACAKVSLKGLSVHPGGAKDKMISSMTLARIFQNGIPEDEVPEKTEGREGFYLLTDMAGTIEESKLTYILRDFDSEGLERKKQLLIELAESINSSLGEERVFLHIFDQYQNMAEVLKDDTRAVDLAKRAMSNLGVEPKIVPIRGGTDGSKISFMGIPTPNLFTGGENYHGRYEFCSLDDMEKAAQVIVEIVKESGK